jgi:hypothetical protein
MQPEGPSASPLHFPVTALDGRRINVSKRAATYFQSGSDARNDLSLACNGCGVHRFHSRVNVPGLPLRFQPIDFTARSIFRSATDLRFAPRSATSMLKIRCRFLDQLDLPLPRPPLPLGTLPSHRIKAFCRTCCKSTRLPIEPDLRSLPAAGFYH